MKLDKTVTLAVVVGFLATMMTNTVLALAVLAPFNEDLGIARTKEQGLNYPALMAGYLVFALVLVWLVMLVRRPTWVTRGAVAGGTLGVASFFAGHLITTGWSVANLAPMAFAGAVDTLAAIAGGILVSRLLPMSTD
jgi:hypothetical protein